MNPYVPEPWIAMGEAILIGLIVGIEREAEQEERRAGLRDFISIGIAGGLCGILNQPWLTVTALGAITALLGIFHWQTPNRTGITTEMAAVVTFLLCVLTGTPSIEWGPSLAIALTVVLALFLDARDVLRKFFRETVTGREYWDTLRFLAVIFVVLPVLPDGSFGPYGGFNPKRLWVFVILVCTISWLGYFLQKFLGGKQGLRMTAIVGGIGSTTAATLEFAREAGEAPERSRELSLATVLANSIQAPRLAAILWIAGGPLAVASLPMLAAITVAGFAYTALLARGALKAAEPSGPVRLGNPLRLTPALKFGLVFAVVRFLARAGTAEFGQAGAYAASAIGGSADVDAIAFTLAGLLRDTQMSGISAVIALLVSLLSNAILKTVFAYRYGGRGFGSRVAGGFAVMFIAGVAAVVLGL